MSDAYGDPGYVRLDPDLAVLLDQLGSVVVVDTAPIAPEHTSVADANGDAALVLLVAGASGAMPALATQITLLRNEMRLTMLSAIAADTFAWTENVTIPSTED